MKKFKLLPLLLMLILSAKAQDKTISINHDTIHCTIVSISDECIVYELKNDDGSVTVKFMPLSQVAEYTCTHQLGRYSEIRKLNTLMPAIIPENSYCLGLNTGISTMPWYLDSYQSSSTIPDFINKLEIGFHINANVHYLLSNYLGLGVEYSFFKNSASGTRLIEYPSSLFMMESEVCRQYINYLGASFLFHQHPDAQQKFIIRESLSAGILFLRLEDQVSYPDVSQSGYTDISNNVLLTGNNVGAKLGLSVEYKVLKTISVGAGGDFILCKLMRGSYEFKGSDNNSSSTNNKELVNPMKLSRIDYSFVVRYNF